MGAETPELKVMPIEGVPWTWKRGQVHADGREVRVLQRVLERTPGRTTMLTRYEPGLVLRQHTHSCDQITHLVEGEFMSGDTLCKAPAVLVLPKGALFGPVVTGPEGATLLEVFLGAAGSTGVDQQAFQRLLDEKGVTLLPEPEPNTPVD